MLIRCCSAALLITVLTACGEGSSPGAAGSGPAPNRTSGITEVPADSKTDEPTQSADREPTRAGITINSAGSEFGQMLFDETGQAIYLFDIEKTSRPRCYDACAEAWPPVLTKGDPVAGQGVDSSLLGTTERRDGTAQVTYNDHPLYFYAHEGKREVKCHNVFLNGGNWYVVRPGGDAAPPG
jgi:predicted lipoprotein with Yx(FWY)xxD motif